MSCLTSGILRAHLDGELPSAEAWAVNYHLIRCPVCRRQAATLNLRAERISLLFTEPLLSLGPAAPGARPTLTQEINIWQPHQSNSDQEKGRKVMVTTQDEMMPKLQFLLAETTLPVRLKRELAVAARECWENPRSFVRDVFKGEGRNRQRRSLLQAGIAVGVMAYAFVWTALLLVGLSGVRNPVEVVNRQRENAGFDTVLVARPWPAGVKSEAGKNGAPGANGRAGGSKPQIQQPHGGGGSGDRQPAPPIRGVPPLRSLSPPIIHPDLRQPAILDPSLPQAMTVLVDPQVLPEMKGQLGDLQGAAGSLSKGPGDGGAIGRGQGHGLGAGIGDGLGPGRDGNFGGDKMAIGGGRPSGFGADVYRAGDGGAGKPTILYKEKAKYTEEARRHHVQGSVMLSAIFTADGRIIEIRVVRGLPDGLTERAIEAAQRIRFQPATRNGVPVNVRANLEFTFALY